MPGDMVEVSSAAEILSTLDANGTLGKLPFMPEMLAFCGHEFRVSRRAFKTCVDDRDMRELDDTVFLEDVRCDGASHGGCDRGCLIFWKTDWLKPVGAALPQDDRAEARMSEADLVSLASRDGRDRPTRASQFGEVARYLWWNGARCHRDQFYRRATSQKRVCRTIRMPSAVNRTPMILTRLAFARRRFCSRKASVAT